MQKEEPKKEEKEEAKVEKKEEKAEDKKEEKEADADDKKEEKVEIEENKADEKEVKVVAPVQEGGANAIVVTGATHARELLSMQVPMYMALKMIHQGLFSKKEKYE